MLLLKPICEADRGGRRHVLNIKRELGSQGKCAIVGGGSRGIGKAIALELAREGIGLVIVSRSLPDLQATARELHDANGNPAEVGRLKLFLASDESSFRTGGVYMVDGGISVGTV